MKLYVANCTQQYGVFNYRMVEAQNPFSQPIEAGQQQRIGMTDMTFPQIEGIINQMRLYGLYVVDELGAIKTQERIVWIASIDKPVTQDKIRQAMVHNTSVMMEKGKDFREKAALAFSRSISERTPHAAEHIEMSVQEETPGSVGPSGSPAIAEGIYVSTDTDKAVTKTGRRNSGGGRR